MGGEDSKEEEKKLEEKEEERMKEENEGINMEGELNIEENKGE